MITSDEEKDWIFVSDAHFTGRDPGETSSFLRFLDREKERMGHLVILGDLFEFFFGFKSPKRDSHLDDQPFVFREYLPVLESLQALYRRGVRIQYFEGNHDFSLHSFFSEHLGMEVDVYPEGCEERLGGRRAYIAHGDLSNPKEWRYRTLRRVLKNRLTYGLIEIAGPRLTRQVARKLNDMSYQRFHEDLQRNPSPAFRAFAHRMFLEGYEIVILGHSHCLENVEEYIDGRRCLYFNVGDWMIHRSFLRFTPPDHFLSERFAEGKGDREMGRRGDEKIE